MPAWRCHPRFRRRARVEGDPIAEQINALLPQTQCGQCGYPGCKPYAEAIAGGDKINKCPPGGEATIRALADLLDVEPEPLDAEGGEKPQMVAYIREAECIGCTKCIEAAQWTPSSARHGRCTPSSSPSAPAATSASSPCPVDCIDMIEVGSNLQSWKWNRPLPPGQLIATDREQAA